MGYKTNGRKMIVYSLEDLKEISKDKGRIGVFALHNIMHDGHRRCAKIAKEKSDFLIGIYHQAFAKQVTMQWNKTHEKDYPINEKTITNMMEYADIVLLHNFYVPKVITCLNDLPNWFNNELTLINPLITSMNIKYQFNHFIPEYVQVSGIRDLWRIEYTKRIRKIFPKSKIILINPVEDELGNNISANKNALPKELLKRINCRITKESIINIKNLKVVNCIEDYGYTFLQLCFKELPNHRWTEIYLI